MILSFRFFLHRILHWEYWPQWLVYAPIAPVYIWHAIRARSPFFMVAANPDMENGGYMMESKYTIHGQLPEQLVPPTFLVHPADDFCTVEKKLEDSGIRYPFFCKPDIGGRGRGVEKIANIQQLKNYHSSSPLSYLLQAAIPYNNEIGVFYCRFPGEEKGFISGIVKKEPVQVKGDGVHTLRQLIEAVPRYYFQRKFLFTKYEAVLDNVIADGQYMLLSEIGNHARGSRFTDCTASNNQQLEKVMNQISAAYNTFYFGRYDIKFSCWEDLYEGKNFMIVELNGSGSEPTHIYDPEKSIWQAWNIIVSHWKIMYRIAVAHHSKGIAYPSLKEGRALRCKERLIAQQYARLEKPYNKKGGKIAALPAQGQKLQWMIAK